MNLGWKSHPRLDCSCRLSWAQVHSLQLGRCERVQVMSGSRLWWPLSVDGKSPVRLQPSGRSWAFPCVPSVLGLGNHKLYVPANSLTEFGPKNNFHKSCFFLNWAILQILLRSLMLLRKLVFVFSSILDVFVGRVGANSSPPCLLQKWLKFAKKHSLCNKGYRLFVSELNHRNQKARRDLRSAVTQVSSVSWSLLLQEHFCAAQV